MGYWSAAILVFRLTGIKPGSKYQALPTFAKAPVGEKRSALPTFAKAPVGEER